MPVTEFPPPHEASPEGIIGVGGDLHPDSLKLAYENGIFPWPQEGFPLLWFHPPKRAVLFFNELHIPKSLTRLKKKTPFRYTIDERFQEVIENCAEIPRPGQSGTWITDEMMDAYTKAHHLGFVHSVEVMDGDQLVGGIYGVSLKGVFSAESMFYHAPNASKLALLFLMNHLKQKGLHWMDIQMLTPHMEAMGAKEISREEFLELLKDTQKKNLKLF